MLSFRFAEMADADLYYRWTNDKSVRQNSYNQAEISYEEHVKWFSGKLASPDCFFYLFLDEQQQPVGQVRIERKEGETIIGISVDAGHRGHSYATEMLVKACLDYLTKRPTDKILAYIKKGNEASVRSFQKAGFENMQEVSINGIPSYKLEYRFK